jgi:hypothetical protein
MAFKPNFWSLLWIIRARTRAHTQARTHKRTHAHTGSTDCSVSCSLLENLFNVNSLDPFININVECNDLCPSAFSHLVTPALRSYFLSFSLIGSAVKGQAFNGMNTVQITWFTAWSKVNYMWVANWLIHVVTSTPDARIHFVGSWPETATPIRMSVKDPT